MEWGGRGAGVPRWNEYIVGPSDGRSVGRFQIKFRWNTIFHSCRASAVTRGGNHWQPAWQWQVYHRVYGPNASSGGVVIHSFLITGKYHLNSSRVFGSRCPFIQAGTQISLSNRTNWELWKSVQEEEKIMRKNEKVREREILTRREKSCGESLQSSGSWERRNWALTVSLGRPERLLMNGDSRMSTVYFGSMFNPSFR